MGYHIFFYAIDANKLKSVIGTNDPALFEQVLATEEFQNYDEDDVDAETSVREALEQMILGKQHSNASKYDEDSPHVYWYSLIALCGTLGEKFEEYSSEIRLGSGTDLIDKYLKKDFSIRLKIDEVLLNGDDDLTKLLGETDFPMCGLLHPQRLAELQLLLAPARISDADIEALSTKDEKKKMAYEYIRQIKIDIDYCLSKGLSLISFCH